MTTNGRNDDTGSCSCASDPSFNTEVARDASEDVYLHSLQPLDKEWVKDRLSKRPFVEVDGVTNVRTLGGYACKVACQGDEPINTVTRENLLFRSGEISGITDKGKCSCPE